MRPDEVMFLRKADIDRAGAVADNKRQVALGATHARSDKREPSNSLPADVWNFQLDFSSSRNPGEYVARLNGPHDRVCAMGSKAGVAFTFVLYDFRQTFTNRLAQAGIDLAMLAAILGHSSIRLVQRYVHPTAEHKRAAMLQYDEIMKAAEKAICEQEGRPN